MVGAAAPRPTALTVGTDAAYPSRISGRSPYLGARCRTRHPSRIEEAVGRRLIEKSVGAETTEDGELVLTLPDGEQRLSREAATALRDDLTAALAGRREFVRTAGEHRVDGSYVVSRANADSAGNAKQFDSFRSIERLYDRLPDRFDATAVGEAAAAGDAVAVSGTRRHLLVRHFAEHPAFDCELAAEQPLTAEKTAGSADTEGADRTDPAEPGVVPTD